MWWRVVAQSSRDDHVTLEGGHVPQGHGGAFRLGFRLYCSMQWPATRGLQSGMIGSDPGSRWGSRNDQWCDSKGDVEQVCNEDLALGMDCDRTLANNSIYCPFN